jgi:predicted RNase H-like HicB family nuclease
MMIEIEREEDGRWIAEVPAVAGAMAYGDTKDAAVAKVQALVLRILADRVEHGEPAAELSEVFTVAHERMAVRKGTEGSRGAFGDRLVH